MLRLGTPFTMKQLILPTVLLLAAIAATGAEPAQPGTPSEKANTPARLDDWWAAT